MTKIDTLPLSDNAIVWGIQNNDAAIIDRFIKEFSPRTARFLIKKGAKESDVEDIVMVALTATYNNIRKKGFELRTALSNYVFQIAKFQFYKYLDKNKTPIDALPEGRDFADDADISKELEEAARTNLLWEKFYLLSEKCQQILTYWLEKIPMNEIAQRSGIPSEGAVRVKKFQCLNNLKQAVWADARFVEMHG